MAVRKNLNKMANMVRFEVDKKEVLIDLDEIKIKKKYEDEIDENLSKIEILKEHGVEVFDLKPWQKVIFDFDDQTALESFE